MESWIVWTGLLLAAAAGMELWSRRRARRGAQRIVEQSEAIFNGTHEFVSVDPAGFADLDLRFYDRLRARLEAEGFRHLGDVEDRTVTQSSPRMRTFVRVMAGEQGAVVAGLYHVRLRGPLALLQAIGLIPRRIQVLELETELEDGRFLVTGNTQGIDTTPSPAGIAIVRLPLASPPERVLAAHRERLHGVLAEPDAPAVRRVGSILEALRAQDRLQLLKNQVMRGPEGLAATIEASPGSQHAKRALIEQVRRAQGESGAQPPPSFRAKT